MGTTNALTLAVDQPALDAIADPLSKAVRGLYEEDEAVRSEAMALISRSAR